MYIYICYIFLNYLNLTKNITLSIICIYKVIYKKNNNKKP